MDLLNQLIYVKGLPLKEVIKEYYDGKYATIDENLQQIKISFSDFVSKRHGRTVYDESYKYHDKNNNETVVQTSNHNNFKLFDEQGGMMKKGGICEYCRYSFDTYSVGYPINFYEHAVERNNRTYLFYVFHLKGEFCTFECTKAYLEHVSFNLPCSKSFTYDTSRQNLLFLYRLIYKDKTLKSAKDKYLLKTNGGTLSREDWLNENSIYICTNKIICAPIKNEYIVKPTDKKKH